MVLDGASCELRFFGMNGVFLERTGGRGEGPGELNTGTAGRCNWVPAADRDSLRAYDGVRLSFFDDRGRFSRRLPVTWRGQRVPRVHGIVGDKVLVENHFLSFSQKGGLPLEMSTVDFALLELESWQPVWEGFSQGLQFYTFKASNGGSDWLNPLPFCAMVGPVVDSLSRSLRRRKPRPLSLGESKAS